MRTLGRKSKLPAIFTAFPWVRYSRGCFADCEEDREVVARYQRIYSGASDVADLDDHYSLCLAVTIPEAIAKADGATDRFFLTDHYRWNLYDVDYLLKGSRPDEAVALDRAGFDEDRLLDLAAPDRYLAYVRALEEFAGMPKGHYFSKELEEELATFERQHRASAKLRARLRGLRVDLPQSTCAPPVTESMRHAVLQDGGYRCVFDGRGRPESSIHVHHIIPQKLIDRLGLSERLYSARENLVACCAGCNIVKSDKLTATDIKFYFEQFLDPAHPNHSVLEYLAIIRNLQQKP
jgi:hypothetical protein